MPLSEKQMKYLALAWQCFETDPKIDYEKFKTIAGLASAASARELMRVTKNKLREEYGALGAEVSANNSKTATPSKRAASGTPTTTTTTTTRRKRAAGKNAGVEMNGHGLAEDDEELGSATPSKEAKKGEGVDGVKAEPRDGEDAPAEEDGTDDIFQ